MKNPRPKEKIIIEDIRNHFRLKKEENETAIKDKGNLFRVKKKEIKAIKDIVLRNIKNYFKYKKQEGNCYKLARVCNVWSNNYIEYKSNGDQNRTLPAEENLYKIRPYLRDIINDLKESDTWKIQLTTTINFISSKDDNDEDRLMHSKSDNIEIIISDQADEVIKNLFDSLKNRYQNKLHSIRCSKFVFDCVQFLYYKCHKINFNHGGLYIDSPYWIKIKRQQ